MLRYSLDKRLTKLHLNYDMSNQGSIFTVQNTAFLLLLFGLVFALVTPPFQSPDEPNHFFRAWQVSEGHFFPEYTGSRLGGDLPASLSEICDSFRFLKNEQKARLNLHSLRVGLSIPLNPGNRRFTDFANTAIYAPSAYLPQAAAIAVLRPLGATPLGMLYGVRLANLIVWVLLISAVLRLIPCMRSTLAAIALLPASLCIAASANADVLTNGLCWYLIAAFLAKAQETVFWKKLLALMVVAANKLIALPLVLLACFSRSDWRQRAILFAVGIVATLLWGRMAQGWFIPYNAYDPAFRDSQTLNSGVDPARQMAFVLGHPVFFLEVCSKSILKALPSLAAHFVGKFGWEKNYLPAGWLLLLWIALTSLVFSEKNPFGIRQRWGLGGIVLLYFGAFSLTMYALWVSVGSTHFDNWQGRYFVPIAPVVVLAIGQGYLEKWKKGIDVFAFTVLGMSNVVMAYCIWGRYWN